MLYINVFLSLFVLARGTLKFLFRLKLDSQLLWGGKSSCNLWSELVTGAFWSVFCHSLTVIYLVKLLVVQSFCHCQFCLSPSMSCLYSADNCWLRFSCVCSLLSYKKYTNPPASKVCFNLNNFTQCYFVIP